jgi:hypothetical protein
MDNLLTDSLFPNHISDEAAFELSEFLHVLALTCDEKYFAQLRRHIDAQTEQQYLLDLTMPGDIEEEDNDNNKPPF